MNNGLFTYLAALLLFGSNGIIAAAIALPSSDIVLLRTFLGALSLVTILAITQRHKLQAPSRPREAAALLLSGAALGASWIFLFRAYQAISSAYPRCCTTAAPSLSWRSPRSSLAKS